MDIRPIRTLEDHDIALREVERLWGAAPSTPDGDHLDVLATLIDVYETETIKIAGIDPIDLLQFAISEMGQTQSSLAYILGSRSRASEILARKRKLTVEHVAAISRAWRLPAELLVQPYALTKRVITKRPSRRRRPTKRPGSSKHAA